ncbi:type II toxin-antitoxin system HicB family antitoxin [Treponema primitia]|uniref:type II toxin-antitoxin system HicB family antitoxin n=1 Tax=Treponema primitia TaxID=88058 RepID=UPI003980A2C8
MRKLTFLAVLEPNGNGGYGVSFPDVPGCISLGDNFDHAVKMGQEALGLHIYGLEKDGDPIPERDDKIPETGKGDIVVPISVYPDLTKDSMDNRREKTTITLPHWLKELAETEHVNYSRVLETALRDTLNIER